MEENKKCVSCSNEPTNKINVQRFIDKVDSLYAIKDLNGALEICKFWEESARKLNDKRGLITVLNEEIGIYRRLNDKQNGINTAKEAIQLINELGIVDNISSATVFVNAATNFSIFDNKELAQNYYTKAIEIYENNDKKNTYEYATLLNNYAVMLFNIEQLDEAEKKYKEAIQILENIGNRDSEIALSYLGLCHLYFDRGTDSLDIQIKTEKDVYDLVENTIDIALKYLYSKNNKMDEHYAFDLSKAVSSLQFFGRIDDAKKVEMLSNNIYDKKNI